jgi:hypothetical protein
MYLLERWRRIAVECSIGPVGRRAVILLAAFAAAWPAGAAAAPVLVLGHEAS